MKADPQEILGEHLVVEFDDQDCYPSDKALEHLAKFQPRNNNGFDEVWEYLRIMWRYPNGVTFERGEDTQELVRIWTGGWDGNEDLVDAMNLNYIIWPMAWLSSHRGGLFYFIRHPLTEAK